MQEVQNQSCATLKDEPTPIESETSLKHPEQREDFETLKSVDEAIDRAGDCGTFQILVCTLLIVGYMTGELIV